MLSLWVFGLGACGIISKQSKAEPKASVIQSETQAPSCKEKGKACSQDAECCSKDCAFNIGCWGKCCFP